MKKLLPLVEILSDGSLLSGEEIAMRLGVSRAAVWKKIQKIQDIGLTVSRVKGLGYQLPNSLELLSFEKILSHIEKLEALELEILPSVASTNSYLVEKSFSEEVHGLVLLAEHQTAGKGRRGREWVGGTPFSNIYLSMGWHYDMGASALEGLSLAVGVELVERLQALLPEKMAKKLALKWPNDILFDGKKLAGILIEIAGDINGGCVVVVGLGLNVDLSLAGSDMIDQPWVDMNDISKGISRNLLAGLSISALKAALVHFEDEDFSFYQERWEKFGAYQGEAVTIRAGDKLAHGVLVGVSKSGSLILGTNEGESIFHGGEVSLRLGSVFDEA